MAQTGYTPISIYYSATATNVPSASNLVAGELAINTADGKLFYKDSSNVVQVIATKGGVGSSTNTQVLYNSSGLVVGDADMTFNGTTLTLANDASISGLTVGKGGGAGANNTALGYQALNGNISGVGLFVAGYQAGLVTTGSYSTFVGFQAGKANTTGENTSYGANALLQNTTGTANIALGGTTTSISGALAANTTGSSNVGVGVGALQANTTASNNTAVGYQAGYSNTTSLYNNYFGGQAGYSQTTGGANTGFNNFFGYQSGYAATGDLNSFFGNQSGKLVTSGAKNTILGAYSGNQGGLDIRTASNYIVLSDGDGNPRLYINASGLLYSVATYNNTSGGAANLAIGASGEFIRSTSSLKYKKDVQDATHGLAEVMQLRPVTYKGKSAQDGDTVFGGLIAEEVDALGLTEFVQYAEDGTPDALAYGNMVSLCIKAIQELKAEVDSLKQQLGK
jgi:hypothetical protein